MAVSVMSHVSTCMVSHRRQEKLMVPMKQELQMVKSCQMWELETKRRSPERAAAYVLNCCSIIYFFTIELKLTFNLLRIISLKSPTPSCLLKSTEFNSMNLNVVELPA